jgi:hypothetical protein
MIDKLAGWLMVAILVGLLAGCASVEQAHEVVALEADKQAEPVLSELPADLADADGASGAVGTLAAPVGKWLGAVILQMFQNVKLSIDVKIDSTDKAVK